MSSSCSDIILIYISSHNPPPGLPYHADQQTNCCLVSLHSTKLSLCSCCILCPGIPEGQGLGYTHLESEC